MGSRYYHRMIHSFSRLLAFDKILYQLTSLPFSVENLFFYFRGRGRNNRCARRDIKQHYNLKKKKKWSLGNEIIMKMRSSDLDEQKK